MKKEILYWTGVGLIIVLLIMVLLDTITFKDFLASAGTIIGLVGTINAIATGKENKELKISNEKLKFKNFNLEKRNNEINSLLDNNKG